MKLEVRGIPAREAGPGKRKDRRKKGPRSRSPRWAWGGKVCSSYTVATALIGRYTLRTRPLAFIMSGVRSREANLPSENQKPG